MLSTRAIGDSSLLVSSRAFSKSPLASVGSTRAQVLRLRAPIFVSVIKRSMAIAAEIAPVSRIGNMKAPPANGSD